MKFVTTPFLQDANRGMTQDLASQIYDLLIFNPLFPFLWSQIKNRLGF